MRRCHGSERRGLRGLAAGLAALVMAGAVSCGPPSPVVQGKVAVIEATRVSVIDELRPDAPPVVLDLSRADMGALPRVGDVVRVVYRVEGGTNQAIALMNVTRQEQNEGKAP